MAYLCQYMVASRVMVLALHITSFHIYTPQQKLFFAVGFLMGIAPIALDILGVESFTIGPANSIFTIFEFHSSGEGLRNH